jgi:hypothetical protein
MHVQVSALSGYPGVANSGLLIERGNGPAALNIASPNTESGFIWFADQDSASVGNIKYDHTDNSMSFQTNSGVRARFNSTGAFVFAGGDTGANGIGITFPAAVNNSSNANTLDDYEEGTWTPVVSYSGSTSGVTYNSRTGNYTKVGNTVLVQGEVSVNSKGTGSGTVQISLPFQNIALRGGLAVGNTQNITGTNAAREFMIEQSTSHFLIRYPSGTGSTSEVDYAAISNGFYVVFAGIYRV